MPAVSPPIHDIHLSGHTGRYFQLGAGPPLLLIASQLVRIQPYRPLFARLADHFHVTVLELPGSGGASKLRPAWGCKQYAHWLEQFLQLQNLNQPLLIAHSTSGAAALLLAARAPQLLSGLIVTGSIGIPRPLLPILLGRALDAFMEWRLTLRRWFDVFHTALFHTRNFFHQVGLAATTDLTSIAPNIQLPVLLAHGRRDHTVPLSCARRLHQLIPHSHLYISPTGSHDWLITNPDEFTNAVLSFVSDFRTAPSTELAFVPS